MLSKIRIWIIAFSFGVLSASFLWAQQSWEPPLKPRQIEVFKEVFGTDWEEHWKEISGIFPEINGSSVPATPDDDTAWLMLPGDMKENIERAVRFYYKNASLVNNTPSQALTEFEVTAIRKIDDYILLWIMEPYIFDGGCSLIYSIENERIVGQFWDGGIRG